MNQRDKREIRKLKKAIEHEQRMEEKCRKMLILLDKEIKALKKSITFSKWHNAVHEAGHAIYAIRLHGADAVKMASIVPDYRSDCHITTKKKSDRPENVARITLAGPFAEHFVYGRGHDIKKCLACTEDLKRAQSLAKKYMKNIGMKRFCQEVKKATIESKGKIRKLARALVAKGTLTTGKIKRVLA